MARAPSPTREARALPRTLLSTLAGGFIELVIFAATLFLKTRQKETKQRRTDLEQYRASSSLHF